ncbi:MAG TPA: carbohydrate binding domain-containing protein [Candidatus Sulfotelmatobacter sp.]|nr:carbohydrate binding domain-containing protein [Candidatus Sulfotelmatobacter sp.]
MQFALNSTARKALVLSIVLLLSAAYLTITGRRFLAAFYGERVEVSSLQRATSLDPTNAEFRNHLGRYQELVARDPGSAIAPFRAAVAVNPHSARYWFDLASAYQILGDTPNQTAALERAIEADPTTPDVAWEAANLYLVQGENQKALREFRVVLSNDPYLAGAAIQFCWRINPDVDALLHDVIPPRADAYIAFLSLLMNKEETAGTAKVWTALMQTSDKFELRLALDYFRYLILHQDVDQAQLVWRQAAHRFALDSYIPNSANLIVNGNFSLDVLNGGQDWQYQKQPSVELTLDPSDFHGGRRSLLITFDGPAVADAGVLQFVPVQPDTTYEFSAYYKIGELEGAGAPHFTLQDAYDKTIYYDSDELKEAGFWKSVNGELTTGPDCRLLILHIRRLPEGSPIRGKLWVDDFHLARKRS